MPSGGPINLPGDEALVRLPRRNEPIARIGSAGLPAGRVSDLSSVSFDAHGCPACPHSCVGPASVGSPNVLINNLPALRVGDNGIHAACCGPNLWTASTGSIHVFINGRPAHRQTDADIHCGGMGSLITGSPTVLIGGPPSEEPPLHTEMRRQRRR